MCHTRLYLRASTDDQDATRARGACEAFATERGLDIVATYIENLSGAKLDRPELFRLIADSKHGDILLVEQVDRLSRLNTADWQRLKGEIVARGIRVVALDLPTSWTMATGKVDEITARVFDAINAMLLDVLAAFARKDFVDRRRRQAEGIVDAKAAGLYKGRPADQKRNAGIRAMLAAGASWTSIQHATGCSRSTIARLAKAA
ncbi:recombinase family protein [Bradyrhizobium jicamae]|uniref:recombinase family protein n=1 Tax=Bradyrhizobium jicamae TaxID=280332 RepID=UPI001BAA981D|nr:recombinase family protein [Bradyrhizobium jicamae]MBR0939035.1 recombinase family protein [Bradyrhizobium jicamae]